MEIITVHESQFLSGHDFYMFILDKTVSASGLHQHDYYEFTKPTGQRLNDEDWQKINYTLDKGNLPSQSDWIKSLYK